MKKYLFGALAMPLLFACSSEDFDEKVVSNDQFAGIAKVDATFSMDEPTTRFDGGAWNTEEGDLWGFAWEGDGTVVPVGTGVAKQNHNLIQTKGIFTPQTSIYVGKYYIYRPYDKTTVSPQAINFNSLVNQPFAEGYASTTQGWKDLAKTAINIGDKWTNVTAGGHTIGTDPTIWDKAGIKEHYKIYAALFSNQTGLDLTYVKNNPKFTAAKRVQGATDIDYTFAANTEVGAADIYSATVDLNGAAKSFTYAPTVEPNGAAHTGEHWADKSNLAAIAAGNPGDGFTFTPGAITLTPEDAVNGISTGADGNKAWFWFNSLPVTAGNGNANTQVQTVLTTSYGVVTVTKDVKDCAYVFEQPDGAAASAPKEWIKIVSTATNQTKSPKEWNLGDAGRKTFINQYGNHKGKYALTVDFSTGVMNNMHIKSDAHLQKLLKYYIASGKGENVTLILDDDATGKFELSKMSIALLQTINAGASTVKLDASSVTRLFVTQDGQAGKKEVPALNNVFNTAAVDVYLDDCEWTWGGDYDGDGDDDDALPTDGFVNKIINEGTITVNASNIELTNGTLENDEDAEMNLTKVTTVKTALTNNGIINVGATDNTAAELRAYDAIVTNNATGLKAFGTINNYGVVGKSAGTAGQVNNYGHINMKDANAITLLNSNEVSSAVLPNGPFSKAFAAGTNMMGTVVLPTGNPYALVSVSNNDETGFIEYTWNDATYSHDAGNVKYNTIVVSNNITFTGAAATEIKFIKFNGTRSQVVNPATWDRLPNLKGIIVNAGKSIILEKTNVLDCLDGAYLGAGATIYRGGDFLCNGANFAAAQTTNYLGTWSLDQIVEW